ncbi:MAG TPA: biotin-dependent carboxyltransferase family protein [Bacillota bacterium]|nr:biotin-dependent carboxyltransferase family protein [Bacillota bacterium]
MKCETLFFVRKTGLLTTFQDFGRRHYQRFGVPVSGGMDQFAMQVANILVGNPRGLACMEVTLVGPELEVCAKQPILVSITGAHLNPKINGTSVPMWQSFYIRKGDILTFGKHQSGVRAYVAVSGGFDVPYVFESQSTDVQSGFGKRIEKSTYINGFRMSDMAGKLVSTERIGLDKSAIPTYKKNVTVSIIEGPHSHAFTNDGHSLFFNQTYTVAAASNRMGYRLFSDKKIATKNDAEIWSDAVPFGGIQIPKDGQPIILMADRQTTGGYPRMGTVISTDLMKIAQLVPHGTIKFKKTSVEYAQEQWIQQEAFLHKLATFRQGF